MAFIDQGEFEAMKSVSGWEAARYDDNQFRAKNQGEYLSRFLSYRCLTNGLNKEE